MMMDFSRYKGRSQVFCNLSGVTKLIINEQDITFRTRKKVEYTTSKLYETKARDWRSHQRHNHKIQRGYFWFRYPCLYGVPGWTLKAASHWIKSVWSKSDGGYDEETRMGGTSKKYCDGWWYGDWEGDRWGAGSWSWFHMLERQVLRVDFYSLYKS